MDTLLLAASPLFEGPATGDYKLASSVFLAAVGAILFVIGLTLVISFFVHSMDQGALISGFILIGIGIFMVLLAAPGVSDRQSGPPVIAQEHTDEVADWLDDDYGIDVSDDGVQLLLDGEQLSVEYSGTDVLIELHRNGDDRITVYSVDTKTSLQPIAEVE